MIDKRTFVAQMTKRFCNEMFSAINCILLNNSDNLDFYLKRVKNFDEIEFDIVIETELEFRKSHNHNIVLGLVI